MKKPLPAIDWRKSEPHLLFLTYFRSPRDITSLERDGQWAGVLNEAPTTAGQRLCEAGVLEPADLAGRLAYTYRNDDLKGLLRERNLPVSGKKEALIERLIQADRLTMDRLTVGLVVYSCTPVGKLIADEYDLRNSQERQTAQERSLHLLQRKAFKEAAAVLVTYDSHQVFRRGLNAQWVGNVAARLTQIWASKPRILRKLTAAQLDLLRVAAGMADLWGENKFSQWLPPDTQLPLAMNLDAAARMMLFHIHQQHDMQDNQARGVKTVTILVCSDACPECAKLRDRVFKLRDCPELPYEHCTHDMGCRCLALPAR